SFARMPQRRRLRHREPPHHPAWPGRLDPSHHQRSIFHAAGCDGAGLRGLSVRAWRCLRRSGTGRFRDLDQDRAEAAGARRRHANRAVEVDWSVATATNMRQVISKGTAIAHPELGHAVHVEVGGLEPAHDYFYQFTIGTERSRIGRARTLPPDGAAVAQIRFALAGCQRYEDGFFTAYRRIAEERFDFVYYYGDYIYERRVMRPGERALPIVRVMPGEPDECFTLDDYRHRYSLYKLDTDLQAAHASAPFIMSFDDHEVSNDWAGTWNERGAPPELFLLRRAAAFQAWYEHVPVRKALLPRGPDLQMSRRIMVGDLLALHVLDTRQFRSPQACGGGVQVGCAEALEPQRTMMGATQERWLSDGSNTAR